MPRSAHRYEVSDGASGEFTITGYFTGPGQARDAFVRAHGDGDYGTMLIYQLDADEQVYGVDDDGNIYPVLNQGEPK